MLNLFVIDAKDDGNVPVVVRKATQRDFEATSDWQTDWRSPEAMAMPNKVALCREDTDELLGLMSYVVDGRNLAGEIVYVESAEHSNSNLLPKGTAKKYIGIARALFAYAIDVSRTAGFDGIIVFKAKTTELMEYYMEEFGARHAGSYDPFRLILWEDRAAEILSEFEEGGNTNG